MALCQRNKSLDDRAIRHFRKYLQIRTVHPDPDYMPAVQYLKKLAEEMQLAYEVHMPFPKKPVLVITWPGTRPDISSILLCSHMDVVPVYEDKWTQKPFAADIVDGKIYARGAQDMKNVGIQHLEAVRRLKEQGAQLLRTVHILYLPDEEIAGSEGMKQFVKTEAFRNLNAGFAFDEAGPSPSDEYVLFNGEKSTWQLIIHCQGEPSHGAGMKRDTASDKAAYILNKVREFRCKQIEKIENGTSTLSDIISMNATIIKGGVQENVVASEISITLDCRLPPDVNLAEWEAMLNQWCKKAGDKVSYEYLAKGDVAPATKLDDSVPFWVAMKEAFKDLGMKVNVIICPGATNAQFVRQMGIPAVGFTPLINTDILVHGNDESIGVEGFLQGISIFCKIISQVANVKIDSI